MRPEADIALRALVERIAAEILPVLPTAYAQGNMGMIATVLAAIADEWDRAAAWRAEENAALKALFATAAPIVGGALAERLRAACAAPDPGLRITALNTANDMLRALLIEVHAAVEDMAGEAARALEARVWAELVAGCRRRRNAAIP